jgi:hypothetical protein
MMEDLLALIENHACEKDKDETVKRSSENLISIPLFNVKEKPKIVKDVIVDSSVTSKINQASPSGVENAVDAKLSIRMLNRKIGSIDLMDLLSTSPYHSPSALVSMTTGQLNQILQDPSPVADIANLTGRANLLTIGIVFTNTGTRISKTGRAFSIIEIGNLVTGPIVTVFLFGDVYGKYNNSCLPGMVIGLIDPSFVPHNPNHSAKDNVISFSVSDQRQFLLVATARDFGLCKGVIKFKRQDGRLTECACKQHVDTRNGPFCDKHRSQGQLSHFSSKKNEKTFLQKLKEDLPLKTTDHSMILQNTIISHTCKEVNQIVKNPFLNKAPKSMIKGQKVLTRIESPPRKNPYIRVKSSVKESTALSLQGNQGVKARNFLKQPQKSLSNRRAVNHSGVSGLNGSVIVPKANPIFAASNTPSVRQSIPLFAVDRKGIEEEILERQRHLHSTISSRSKPSHLSTIIAPKSREGAKPQSSVLGNLVDIDIQKVLSAKSRFEVEVMADAYALSRNKLVELEKAEEREGKKFPCNAKTDTTLTTKVRREWICVTCSRTSGIEPKMCRRLGHAVKCQRSIEESKTLTEQRLQLQGKAVEDGGIRLGAGVEWTTFIQR